MNNLETLRANARAARIGAPSDGHRIRIAFEIYTPESIAAGEAEERGWEDERGVSVEPDRWDVEEGKSVVDLAVKLLRDEGVSEASSSTFQAGVWYWTETIQNRAHFERGINERHSFHLAGFTEDEERAVWTAITGRTR